MKIPTAAAPNGPYYHGPANGMELNPQWQGNGVILEAGPPGNGGPYMVPHHVHPAGFAPPGGFYQGAGSPGQPQDFSEYMWMENEEEFDKQVMQQLEEEALMEQCIEAMLADEREALGRGDVNLEEAVSKSTLNPLAAEFVPTFIPVSVTDAVEIPTVSSRGTPEAVETFIEKASETLSEVSLSKSDDSSKPADVEVPPIVEAVKTNSVARAVETVVVVSAIEGIVKEEKRHQKSDAERKKSSESVKKEAAKKVESKEPKKVEGKEPVKRVDSKEAVKKTEVKETVKKVDAKEAVKRVDSKEPVKKADGKETVKKVDSKEPLKKADSKETVKKVEGKEPLKKVDSKEAVKRAEVKRPTKTPPTVAKVAEKKKEDVVIDLQGPPLPSVATAAPVEVEKPVVSAPAVFNYAAAARANLPAKVSPAATSAPPSKETTPIASQTATTGNQTASAKPPAESANKDTPRNATASSAAKTKPTEKGGVKDDKRPFKSVGAAKKGKK